MYAARNLASILQSLHAIGHYVVDLKPQNVLVYRDTAGRNAAHVALVDCDGFQVCGGDGTRFDAALATAEFLHPSVARQSGDAATFDTARLNDHAELQDNFALAVILFQSLNDGLHPMDGIETGAAPVPSELALRLQAGGTFYPYGRGRANQTMRPKPDSLHPWFDKELQNLFDRAFAGGMPPSPGDWAPVLTKLSDESRRCPRNDDHWRLGKLCGQCALDDRAAPTPFLQIALPTHPTPVQHTRRLGRIRRWTIVGALAAAAVAGSWFLSSGTLGRIPSLAAIIGPSTEQRAVNLVRAYYQTWSQPGTDVSALEGFYGSNVIFFGDSELRSKVMYDKKTFSKRWPVRRYRLNESTVSVRCTSVCNVSGVVNWDVGSIERAAHSTGSARFTFSVIPDKSGSRGTITAEDGAVLVRHTDNSGPRAQP